MPQNITVFLVKFFGIYLIQGFVFIFSMYAMSAKRVARKPFIISALIFTVACAVSRMLPIQFGVPTLLTLLAAIWLGIWQLKLPVYQSIRSALITVIVLLGTEVVDILMLKLVFGNERYTEIMENELTNALAGIPANLLLFVVTLAVYILFVKCKKQKTPDAVKPVTEETP